MYELKASAAFDSAHFLKGYDGKCANLHGHRWTIEAVFSQESLQPEGSCRGMAVDFGILKKQLRELADGFDHGLIYEKGSLLPETLAAMKKEQFHLIAVDFRPTAECFAKYFFDVLSSAGCPVSCVTVYETPDNCASYRRDKE